jgi:hypothetical protein
MKFETVDCLGYKLLKTDWKIITRSRCVFRITRLKVHRDGMAFKSNLKQYSGNEQTERKLHLRAAV